MKKITLNLLVLLVTAGLWQVNAQTFTGDNLGAGISNTNPTTLSNASVTTPGVIGSAIGEYAIDNVLIDINHTFDGDMDIQLVAPSGASVSLSDNNGSNGDNYSVTVFDDDSAAPIGDHTAPFNGTFAPDMAMNSSFAGEDITGNWQLRVTDDFGGDNGTLNNYQITLSENRAIASSTFCSTETPLDFAPPLNTSASVAVTNTTNSGDLGVIGTGLGEYVIANVIINSITDSAGDRLYRLQSPNGTILMLDAANGGSDGLDVAADLVFTDLSSNDIFTWGGGAPLADYMPQGGDFASTFAGESITGNWFLIVESNPGNQAGGTVNSFCITFEMMTGNAPEIFCIADFTADSDEGFCGAVVNFAPPLAIDNEDGVLAPSAIVQTGGILTGNEFPVGDNDVTFTATDSNGNMTSCTFVITVFDVEEPVAVCQAFTVTLDAAGNGSMVAADIDGGSTDNCNGGLPTVMSASQTIFGCSDVGDVEVVLEVMDDAGNTSSCIAVVTVIDDIAPVVTCIGAPGLTVYTEGFDGATIPAGWSSILINGTDDWNYGDAGLPLGTPFSSNAVYFNDDAAGNGSVNALSLSSPMYDLTGALGATLSYEVSFEEFGDQEFTIEVWDGAAWQQVDFYDASTGGAPIASGDIDVLAYANAGFQVRYTYDDLGGWGWQAGIDSFSLTVDTPPAPPLELALNADGTLSVLVGDLIDDVDEACGFTITSGSADVCSYTNPGNAFEGATFNNGAPFATANDFIAAGDFTLNQVTMNLWHNVGTTVADMTFTFYADNAGLPGAVISTQIVSPTSQAVVGSPFAGAFDASEVVYDIVPTSFAAGTYWIGTIGAASDAGVLGWENTTASLIGSQSSTSDDGVTWAPGTADGVYTFSGVCGASDPTVFSFDCSNLGENVVEVFVTDNSGNSSSCFATVIISDVTAPVLVCGPGDGATSLLEDFEGSSLPTGWSTDVSVGSWDWTFGSPDMPNSDPFTTNAAIFNDDAAGNGEVNTASLLSPMVDLTGGVTVASISYDYTLDELAAGETLTVDVWDGTAWQQVALYDADVIPTNSGAMDVLAYANADFQVRFTYDDAGSWGWGAGVDNLQVDYAIPPTSSDIIVELGDDGTTTLDPMDFLSESFDACGIEVLIADLEMVTCDDIGAPITVTVFATDASGNIASCSVQVLVVDAMAPVLTCPEDESVMVDADGTHTVGDYIGDGLATATDNCTDPITDFTQSPAAGTILGVGVWAVTFTATDEYGNVSTCEMELDLTLLGAQDNELNNAIALYPNPANGQVTISNSSNIALETAMIYDLNGKLVSQINLQNMQSEKVIDVASFATGVYMVHITGEQSSVVKRLIKE